MKRYLFILAILIFTSRLYAQTYTVVQQVQNQGGTSGGTVATVIGGAITAGNSLFVSVGGCANSGCTSQATPTSAWTNTPTAYTWTGDANGSATATGFVDLGRTFNVMAAAGGTTITNTLSASANYMDTAAVEINGLGASPAYDTGTANQNFGSALSSIATGGAVAQANEFCIVSVFTQGTTTFTNSWNVIGSGATGQTMAWIKAGTGTITATWTGASGLTGAAIACYKPTAAGGVKRLRGSVVNQ